MACRSATSGQGSSRGCFLRSRFVSGEPHALTRCLWAAVPSASCAWARTGSWAAPRCRRLLRALRQPAGAGCRRVSPAPAGLTAVMLRRLCDTARPHPLPQHHGPTTSLRLLSKFFCKPSENQQISYRTNQEDRAGDKGFQRFIEECQRRHTYHVNPDFLHLRHVQSIAPPAAVISLPKYLIP